MPIWVVLKKLWNHSECCCESLVSRAVRPLERDVVTAEPLNEETLTVVAFFGWNGSSDSVTTI